MIKYEVPSTVVGDLSVNVVGRDEEHTLKCDPFSDLLSFKEGHGVDYYVLDHEADYSVAVDEVLKEEAHHDSVDMSPKGCSDELEEETFSVGITKHVWILGKNSKGKLPKGIAKNRAAITRIWSSLTPPMARAISANLVFIKEKTISFLEKVYGRIKYLIIFYKKCVF